MLRPIIEERTRSVRICICGCSREFEPSRPWQKFFESACRFKNWRSRRLRKRANKRAEAASNALQRIPARVYSRRRVQPGSIRTMLRQIAQLSPDFFLRLADELRDQKPGEAAS